MRVWLTTTSVHSALQYEPLSHPPSHVYPSHTSGRGTVIGMSTCVAGYISFHALVAILCFSWLGYTLGQTITALNMQPSACNQLLWVSLNQPPTHLLGRGYKCLACLHLLLDIAVLRWKSQLCGGMCLHLKNVRDEECYTKHNHPMRGQCFTMHC